MPRRKFEPGHGGPASGDLGHGPAKGFVRTGKHPPFTTEEGKQIATDLLRDENGKYILTPERLEEEAVKAAIRAEALNRLLGHMRQNKNDILSHNAAVSLLNQMFGMPTQRMESSGPKGGAIVYKWAPEDD
jgi:hypothetical protein